MAAEIGKKAPDFTLASADGDSVKLSDYRGSYVVLYFYPKDMTEACTRQACELRDANEELKRLGAVVVGVSTDEPGRHVKFREKYALPFVLLSDPQHKACEKYGVWQLKKLYGHEYMGIVRSTFLIDPKGKLVREWRNVKVKGHAEMVLQALQAIG